MEVRTPRYWKEEKYQPLIEVETAYGNKVAIPQSLRDIWDFWKEKKGKFPRDVERAKAAGFFKRTAHNRIRQDTMLVYYEEFQE